MYDPDDTTSSARDFLREWDEISGMREDRRREAARLYAALMVAADVDTCCALLRGEDVPEDRLRPDYIHLLSRWTSVSTPSPLTT